MIKKCYIYKITNIEDNKSYIGSRIHNFPEEDNYMGSGKLILNSYKDNNKKNFKKEIIKIYENISKEFLLDKESYYIIKYGTLNPHGYNLNLPNKHTKWHRSGIPLSEKAKQKISEGLIKAYKEGRKIVPDYSGELHPMWGKHHTAEAKQKCGNSFRGKHHKESTKKKMSESLSGVKKTVEHAKNISKGRKGIVFTKEHCKNISKSLTGRESNISIEGRKRISDATLKLNKQRIKCSVCGREFNPGNYGRHMKTTHRNL